MSDLLGECHSIVIISWLIYFSIHSLLASLWLKQHIATSFSSLMPYYRLFFNLIAVVSLSVPLYLMYTCDGPLLIQWSAQWKWLSWFMLFAALVLFVWTTRYYDGSEFIGLRQIRDQARSVADQERFKLSPVHRFVRHPWYFVGLLFIWSRDMNLAFFISAVMMTMYFFLGSRIEERKLIEYHGEVYRHYRKLVPGIVPLPWKYLSIEEADRLLDQ